MSSQLNYLETIIKKQGEEIERLHDTIYYILGNIHTNNESIVTSFNYMKYGKFVSNRWLLDTNDDGSDEYAIFFENRSKEATKITQEENKNYEEDDDCSTHSSMPSLVSVSSVYEQEEDDCSTHSSMPSLVYASSSDSEDDHDYYKLPPSSDE